MLVHACFPSDGEYQITMTPIFGDNMSPTGFGSVPCEKLEVLLDGERIAMIDWQGGGRAPAANCGGAPGSPPCRVDSAARISAATECKRYAVTATAGPHMLGVTFLQTNFAPVLDLDQHFMRDTVQTGPTPGFTYLPARRHGSHRGSVQCEAGERSPSRRKIFVCHAGGRGRRDGLRAEDHHQPGDESVPASGDAPPTSNALMEFYKPGRKEGNFEHGIEMALARVLAVAEIHLSHRSGAGECEARRAVSHQPISTWRRACRSSCGARARMTSCCGLPSQGRLKDPAVLEQQVRRMLKDPKAEALAVNFAGQWLNLRGLQASEPAADVVSRFRRSAAPGDAARSRAALRQHRPRRPPITELLTADYTFVNERLAKHYGIPNIYGSQFRRVTLGPDMDMREGPDRQRALSW